MCDKAIRQPRTGRPRVYEQRDLKALAKSGNAIDSALARVAAALERRNGDED